MMPPQVGLTCARCGTGFNRSKTLHRHDQQRGRKRAFCSPECYHLATRDRVTLTCEQCGDHFTRNPRTVRRRKALGEVHQFCSSQCAWASPLRRGLMGARRANLKPSPIIDMTPGQLGYLAGIVDGEGSFNMSALRRRQINVAMTVSNTDRRILDFCQSATGLGRVIQQGFRKGPKHRVQFVWNVGARNELRAILPLTIPFLVGKADQARLVLEYCERRAEGGPQEDRDFELCDLVKALNRRGKPAPE